VMAGESFKVNFTHQDAAVLSILRGCEAAVDLANMLIRKKRLGLPGEMKDSFVLLERSGFILPNLSRQMQNMVGFRNIAVHRYRDLDLDVSKTSSATAWTMCCYLLRRSERISTTIHERAYARLARRVFKFGKTHDSMSPQTRHDEPAAPATVREHRECA
jgi:uncharacterized protein YutE (UPF0331/DUF86 family)